MREFVLNVTNFSRRCDRVAVNRCDIVSLSVCCSSGLFDRLMSITVLDIEAMKYILCVCR